MNQPFDMLEYTNKLFDTIYRAGTELPAVTSASRHEYEEKGLSAQSAETTSAGRSFAPSERVRDSAQYQFPAHPRTTLYTRETANGSISWEYPRRQFAHSGFYNLGTSPTRYAAVKALLETRADHREARAKLKEWRS